jgi:hypothetical protein
VVNSANSVGPLITVFETAEFNISFSQLLNFLHEAEWTPFQSHYFSENMSVPGIEPGTSGSTI